MTVFATAIAITKDLPDVEGDRKHNIDTFATRLGTRAVARVGGRSRARPDVPILPALTKACVCAHPVPNMPQLACVAVLHLCIRLLMLFDWNQGCWLKVLDTMHPTITVRRGQNTVLPCVQAQGCSC